MSSAQVADTGRGIAQFARVRPHLCWLAILATLAACGNDTPDQKLAKDIHPATSWASTLQFASEVWLDNRVPSAFVRETVKAAQKAFDQAQKAIDQSRASAQMRSDVAQQLRAATDAASELQAAIRGGDRAAVGRARNRSAAAYQALRRIEDSHKQ